jgi:hypothetical protein
MDDLFRRIECQQAAATLHCVLDQSGLTLKDDQLREAVDRKIAKSLSLETKPVLEGRLFDGNACQQVATIEIAGIHKCLRRSVSGQLLEGHDVDAQMLGIEGDVAGIGSKCCRGALAQRRSNYAERLSKAVPGVAIVCVGPEQRRKLAARMALTRVTRKV